MNVRDKLWHTRCVVVLGTVVDTMTDGGAQCLSGGAERVTAAAREEGACGLRRDEFIGAWMPLHLKVQGSGRRQEAGPSQFRIDIYSWTLWSNLAIERGAACIQNGKKLMRPPLNERAFNFEAPVCL